MDGTIVIGEGERDEAPMLYIGEKVGGAASNGANGASAPCPRGHRGGGQRGRGGHRFRGRPGRGGRGRRRRRLGLATPAAPTAVDIAVDPLEGTNLVARGQGGRHLGAGRGRAGRAAARPGHLHGEALRRPPGGRAGADGVPHRRQPAHHRGQPQPPRRGHHRGHPRPRAAQEADRGRAPDRGPDPADRRRRPHGRHLRGRLRHRRPLRDGQRGRARGRPHRRPPCAAWGARSWASSSPATPPSGSAARRWGSTRRRSTTRTSWPPGRR